MTPFTCNEKEQKMRKSILLFVVLAALSPCFADVISDSLLKKIEVGEIKLQFHSGDADCRDRFFSQFAMTPFVEQFFDLSTGSWYATRIQYQKQIMRKARDQGFDTSSLARCFEKIPAKPMDEIAQIPIAAYCATQDQEKIWVILFVWEYATNLNGKPLTTGHIKGWAFSAKNRKQLCFMSCM
jgi:hypothetical protein